MNKFTNQRNIIASEISQSKISLLKKDLIILLVQTPTWNVSIGNPITSSSLVKLLGKQFNSEVYLQSHFCKYMIISHICLLTNNRIKIHGYNIYIWYESRDEYWFLPIMPKLVTNIISCSWWFAKELPSWIDVQFQSYFKLTDVNQEETK